MCLNIAEFEMYEYVLNNKNITDQCIQIISRKYVLNMLQILGAFDTEESDYSLSHDTLELNSAVC